MISLLYYFCNAYVLLACAITLFWYYSRSTYNYWHQLNVKYLRPIPFFGNTAKIVLQMIPTQEMYHRLYRALGDEPYGGIFELRDPVLLVKDPRLVSQILVKDFKNFYDRGRFLFFNPDKKLNPFSVSLFFMDGERWRLIRQKMSPAFTSGKLKKMQDQICDCVGLLNEYIDRLMSSAGADSSSSSSSTDVALKELFQRLTVDVIGCCAFGVDCNTLTSNDQFNRMADEIFKPKLANCLRVILSGFGSKRLLSLLRIRDHPKEANDFFVNLTLDTMAYRRQNGVVKNDFLQLLMNLQNSHVDKKFAFEGCEENVLKNEEFDETDIASNAFLFFLAGFETTASTLSFCFYELALNQDIQQKLRNEVQQVKNKYKVLNYESYREMPYMEAVICETLRKYPPLVILNRICTEDFVISSTNTRIPAGTHVVIPVWSIHHDWRYYPNPEVFDPDRFLADKHKEHSGIYMPFGNGPRYCIGKRFAEMEVKTALSDLILKYDFKPCQKTEIPLNFKASGFLLLQTECGVWVNMTKRKD